MSFIALVTALSGLCIVSAGLIFSLKNREMSEKGRAESERALEAIKTRRVILPSEPENEEGQDLCIYKSSVEGTDYIGTLKIEKLELELPVAAQWSYDQLQKSPCLYFGDSFDCLVIAAHNYSSHFGKLKQLEAGDEIIIENIYGEKIKYRVELLEVLSPFEEESMTAGDYNLTLFTCTPGGGSRLAVRCSGD